MHLYNLTLQRASGITHAVCGSFSGSPEPEIVISRGKSIELLRLDSIAGKLINVLAVELFGSIRALISFLPPNDSKDYIALGTDTDRLVILKYVASKNAFEKVYQDSLSNSGCKRTVPGQYVAADPKGRTIMSGAVEKQKLLFHLNKDLLGLTVSSITEAHRNNNLVYHIVGLDVGYKNPVFACLEIDCEEADKDPTGEAAKKARQLLSFYEQDLKLHSEMRYCKVLEEHANLLVPVPGGSDGPSGVIVCFENYLAYKIMGNHKDIRCPIPRRRNDLDEPERGILFVCSATHKTPTSFFFFLQTEQGDIFKVTLGINKAGGNVSEIKLKYFDTVPVASSICILKTGFLFVAAEFGNHHLYQIVHLGEDDDEPEFSSALPLEEGETFFFAPRPLRNLILVDEIQSLSPILDCHVTDLTKEGFPQLYMACGRGPKSTFKVLRHGLEVTELSVSELRGNPNSVWTIKKRMTDNFDSYIVLSFSNSSMVLSIGETLEEISNSGLSCYTSTLACSNMGTDGVIQVYPSGFKLMKPDKRHQDWKVPGKKQIIKCTVNQRQLVLALTGGILAYFLLDSAGQLKESAPRKEVGSDVTCLGLTSHASGDLSKFVVVGISDNTVIIVSLDYNNCLNRVALVSIPCWPESLCIIETSGEASSFYLTIGLYNGTLLQTIFDPVTGDLSDTRTKNLGTRPVKLFPIKNQGKAAVLAVSSRTWLSYRLQNRFHLTPLSYDPLDYASRFSSKQCQEGIVAISSNTVRILSLEKMDSAFSQVSYPLDYTPKKFVIHPETGYTIIIESDHNIYTEDAKTQRRLLMAKEMEEIATEAEKEIAREMAQDFLNDDLPEKIYGTPRAGAGTWASLIRILNPATGETNSVTRLEQNEAALSMALVKFRNQPDNTTFLIVGVAKDYVLNPRQISSAYLNTYRITSNCSGIELVHRTVVNDLPLAMCAFHGRLIVGVGKLLRLYEMGKEKLLHKSESKDIPNLIVRIETTERRIFVYDVQESVFFVRYKLLENRFIIFADDTQPRWITTSCILDLNTVATADKFGNISVIRLDASICDDVDEDPNASKTVWDRGLLNSVSQKADFVAGFHVGEVVKSIQKVSLTPGGCESLMYTTLSGSIGLLIPLLSHEDQDFFQLLEKSMRSKLPSLIGWGHVLFRSYYYPLKNVVDGDLCEQFFTLEPNNQQAVSQELCKASNLILKKIEDVRFRYAAF